MSVILLEDGSRLLLEDGGFFTLELPDSTDDYVGGYGSGLYSKGLYGDTRLIDGTPVAIFGASTLGAYAERIALGVAIVEAVSSLVARSRLEGGAKAKVFAVSDVRADSRRVLTFRVEDVTADSLVAIAPTLLARASALINGVSDVRANSNASLVANAQAIRAVSQLLANGRGIYLPEDPITAEWAEQEGMAEIWTASNPDDTIWSEKTSEPEIWTPADDNNSTWTEAAL